MKESASLQSSDDWDDAQSSVSRGTNVSSSIFSDATISLRIFDDNESVTIAPRNPKIKPHLIEVRTRNVPATEQRICKSDRVDLGDKPRTSSQQHPTKAPFSPRFFTDEIKSTTNRGGLPVVWTK